MTLIRKKLPSMCRLLGSTVSGGSPLPHSFGLFFWTSPLAYILSQICSFLPRTLHSLASSPWDHGGIEHCSYSRRCHLFVVDSLAWVLNPLQVESCSDSFCKDCSGTYQQGNRKTCQCDEKSQCHYLPAPCRSTYTLCEIAKLIFLSALPGVLSLRNQLLTWR